MRKLLTVFIDGLKPESVKYMPFVNGFKHKGRIKTEFGYSITCHSSMYSGVRPNKHLRWFLWQRNPGASMYRWTRAFSGHPLSDCMITAYMAYGLTKLFYRKNTSYYGVKYNSGAPFRYWREFDMAEKRLWEEPGFLPLYPTLFDMMRKHSIPFKVSGMHRSGGPKSLSLIDADDFKKDAGWVYLFIGEIDALTHVHGQESDISVKKIKEADSSIERVYTSLAENGDKPDFLLFSDHGQIRTDKAFDIKACFKERGLRLSDYIHIIDNNFARFWFRTGKERGDVGGALDSIKNGFVLTPDLMREHNVDMPDNRYGDMIFYLDEPYAFIRPWNPLGLRPGPHMFSHGYLPDKHPGALVSNRPLRHSGGFELVDIMPSVLSSLNIKIPGHVDGKAMWEKDG